MSDQMVWHLIDGESVQIPRIDALKRFKERRESHLRSRKDWFAQFGEEDPWKNEYEAFYDAVDEALK